MFCTVMYDYGQLYGPYLEKQSIHLAIILWNTSFKEIMKSDLYFKLRITKLCCSIGYKVIELYNIAITKKNE